jgi:hypothetical protein
MTMNMFDALSAPEFMDQASYVRTTRVIGANGLGSDTQAAPVAFNAIVIPDGSNLHRWSDGSRLSSAIRIYTQTFLTNGLKQDDANSLLADVVLWHGRSYTVTAVQDFDDFSGASLIGVSAGAGVQIGQSSQGFWVVSADLLPLNPSSGA